MIQDPHCTGGFGFRNFLALNGVNPKSKETGKRLTSGTNADVGLHEGGVTRKIENGVAGKIVRLELVKIQKAAEEVRGRKAEAALEVSKKDDELTGSEYRFDLVAGKPAGYPFRYPSGPVKPVDLVLGDVGAYPGSACDTGKIYSGGSVRTAGLLFVAGIGIHPGQIGS
jgi:hypothetical protein